VCLLFEFMVRSDPSRSRTLHPYELDIPVTWVVRPSREDYLAAKMRAWNRESVRPSVSRSVSKYSALKQDVESYSERQFINPVPGAVNTLPQRWSYFRDLAAREMKWHGLTQQSWKIKYDRSRTCAGECDLRTKTLSFSRYLIARGPLMELRNTLLHEIAHALAGAQYNHDRIWRKIALKIGCDGERCYNFELVPPKWLFRCSAGCWETRRHRRHSIGTKQTCKKCDATCIYVAI
jgi:predicted SprT family Zn-dependent metalloprotease